MADGRNDAPTPGEPWDDARRVAELRDYGVLDTEAEAAFDELATLAARLCDAPIALVSLIDDTRQWFKARTGLDLTQTERRVSFCDHAIRQSGVMVVPDATADARFADNPLVTGSPRIRFYAGAPIVTGSGLPLGSVCVIDTKPRADLTPVQRQALETLARQVMAQLELRRDLLRAREREERLERALDASAHVGAWDWEIQPDRVVADERFARMFGVDPEEAARGVPIDTFVRAIHPDDRPAVEQAIQTAVETLGHYEVEYRVVTSDRARWVLARGQVYGDPHGQPIRFAGTVADISQRKAVEAELAKAVDDLAESEAKFRAIADSMPQMVWSTLPDGFHDYYNARWYEFTGVPFGSTDGEGWNDMFHPEDQERAWTRWRHSLETGEPYEIEYRLKHHSGVYRWTLGRAMPIRDGQGRITRWFGTCTDIDDIKKMESAQNLISQELSHRIKNIFAVVSALIALSARQHPEAADFARALKTRVGALARAHEFVRPHTESSRPTVGSMTLHAFLRDLFKAYAGEDGLERVMVSGDDAVFDDQAATSVALLFHELATNAAKYGALSVDGGRVTLETRTVGDRFVLEWREAGGPPVAPPTRTGFGSSLAALSVEGQLGGSLSRDWSPDGLRVIVDLPVTALSRRRAAMKVA
ncbi:PAS domain-containing protein [Brevundimonas balnearis]|uniref:histidine kinase n=1 Tax=Brevundimonas balnearis TaxID=1572858 RepID=A0ABV6R058_9CAUL